MNGNRDEVLASLFASHYTSLVDAAEKYVFAFYPDRSEIVQDAISALTKKSRVYYERAVLLVTAVLDDMASRDAFENWHVQEAYRKLLEALEPMSSPRSLPS